MVKSTSRHLFYYREFGNETPNASKSSPNQSNVDMEQVDLHHDATTTFDWTPPTEINQHQPDNIQPPPRHQYPNGHLEPSINPNLPRNLRNRHPPQRYIPEDGR